MLVFSFLMGRRAKKERSLFAAILDNALENRLEASEPFWSAVTGAALALLLLISAGLSAVLFTFESTITICADEFLVCVLFKC